MLRISVVQHEAFLSLVIEGRLVGPWSRNYEGSVSSVMQRHHRFPLTCVD